MATDQPESARNSGGSRTLSHRGCEVYFVEGGVILVPSGPYDLKDPSWSWRRNLPPFTRLADVFSARELGEAIQEALTREPSSTTAIRESQGMEAALKAVGFRSWTRLEHESKHCAIRDLGNRIDVSWHLEEPLLPDSCELEAEAIGRLLLNALPRCPEPAPLVKPRPGRSHYKRKLTPVIDGGLPETFGYKTGWIVVDSTDAAAVADGLGLQELRPQTWSDIDPYDLGEVFVSPAVLGWTFILGDLKNGGDFSCFPERMSGILCDLGRLFGEAQFFCTHRIVDFHCWAKAIGGRIDRAYCWFGERGQLLWDEGSLTPEEVELGFARFLNSQTVMGDWAEWTTPSESDVMDIAGRWSITPQEIDAYEAEGVGFLGWLPDA